MRYKEHLQVNNVLQKLYIKEKFSRFVRNNILCQQWRQRLLGHVIRAHNITITVVSTYDNTGAYGCSASILLHPMAAAIQYYCPPYAYSASVLSSQKAKAKM